MRRARVLISPSSSFFSSSHGEVLLWQIVDLRQELIREDRDIRLLQPRSLEDVQHLRARHRLRYDLPNGVIEVCFRALLMRSHFVQD